MHRRKTYSNIYKHVNVQGRLRATTNDTTQSAGRFPPFARLLVTDVYEMPESIFAKYRD